MKTLIALTLLLTHSALARLGESHDEIRTRYGEPLGADSIWGMPLEIFHFQTLRVSVVFIDGRSAGEILDADKLGRMEDPECLALIQAIAPGEWKKIPFSLSWKQADSAFAQVNRGFNPGDSLWIMSTAAKAKMESSMADDKKNLISAFATPVKPPPVPTAAEVEKAKKDRETEELHRQWLAAAAKESALAKRQTADAKLLDFQREKAEQGDAYGQCAMGLRYLKGDGVDRDPQKARTWLEKSAGQGYPEAKTALATLPPFK